MKGHAQADGGGDGLDIAPETRPDHAATIASWLKVLKDDKRVIYTAATRAQKAANDLNGLRPHYEGDETDLGLREAA